MDIIMKGKSYVFHMAVLPINPCEKDIRLCVETNIMGTLNVVEAAKKAGVKKLIYSSTSSVYGNMDNVEYVNETQPCNSDAMYGVSKRMGEVIVKSGGVPFIILRYMNVYGYGQANGLIPTLLKCLDEHVPPTINGDGTSSFDYVHVDDIVAANILAAESDITGEIFNIGGDNEITLNQVVGSVLLTGGSDLTPVHREGTNIRRVGSSRKAIKMLGYRPSIKFNEGIKELVDEHTHNKTIHG
jgi:UDP-glucose 4-epimerase